MSMRTIGVPKSEMGIIEYLSAYPLEEGVLVKIADADCRKFFTFEAEDEAQCSGFFVAVVAEVLSTFYKTRTLLAEIKNFDLERLDIVAYLGTLSAFERAEEQEKVARAIGADKFVNLDGIFNFRLDAVVDGWTELGRLAQKLINECVSIPEVRELTAFMLGMAKVDGVVRLAYLSAPKVEKRSKFYPIASVTGCEDADIIFSLLKEAPKSIVVPCPERFSEQVRKTIRALGEE